MHMYIHGVLLWPHLQHLLGGQPGQPLDQQCAQAARELTVAVPTKLNAPIWVQGCCGPDLGSAPHHTIGCHLVFFRQAG